MESVNPLLSSDLDPISAQDLGPGSEDSPWSPGPVARALPEPRTEDREAWEAALRDRLCLHCGGALEGSWRIVEGPFCCRGCSAVYDLIHGTGLSRYYDLRQGRQAPAATLRPASQAWLDRLLEEEGLGDAKRPFRLSLDIQGVHCAACIWLLEELYRRQAGGLDLKINPTLGRVDLVWDPTRGDLHHYLAEVERFGYRLGPPSSAPPSRSRSLLLRMAVSIAIALNVMMFSVSFYLGLAPTAGRLFDFFGILSLLLATVSVVVGGQVFFRGALAGLRRGLAHLDLPISVGILLAYGGSVAAYLAQGPQAAYFDSLTLFVALMLVGRWAQERVLERNRNALLESAGAEGIFAKRRREGRLDAVPAPEIQVGDELWISPGDLVPVQGMLLRRQARVSLDWITGESDQMPFEPGETVPAGAFNAGGRGFPLTAIEAFADSRLNDLLRSDTLQGETYRPRWWTRIGTGYVAAVLLLAGLGLLVSLPRGLPAALKVTVAILVVTCPCALGLATPLAQEMMHHALRLRGIFVRRPDFLDRALRVKKVLLDKTGTLTLGDLALTDSGRQQLIALDDEARSVLWNMVARSNHPVSRALTSALKESPTGDSSPQAMRLEDASEAVRERPGQGLRWQRTGRDYRLGRAGFETGEGSAVDGTDDKATLFTADGGLLAAFEFAEVLKADAVEEMERLRAAGLELHLLSGDSADKVERVRRKLGIREGMSSGGLDPAEKAAIVTALDRQDTLMVGDGLNDSPSFAAAFCTATPAVDRPVLPGKADFYFLGDGMAALRRSLAGARHLRRVIRDNLVVAVVYNIVAVALCMAGLVTPVIAAILMPISSVGVVGWTVFRLSGRRLSWMS